MVNGAPWRRGTTSQLAVVCAWIVAAGAGRPEALADPSVTTAQASGRQPVACRSLGTTPLRTWTFVPAGDMWRVTHETEGDARIVSLLLPRATATLDDHVISLRARTANGGIDITLSGPWDRATLDAYVNYELEVNVDASLTPDIDHISTDTPLGVACRRVEASRRPPPRGPADPQP